MLVLVSQAGERGEVMEGEDGRGGSSNGWVGCGALMDVRTIRDPTTGCSIANSILNTQAEPEAGA